MISFHEAVAYEMRASAWWLSFVFWGWGQDLAAAYIVRKAKRKHARYLFWSNAEVKKWPGDDPADAEDAMRYFQRKSI